jgi:hypothetical protein
MTIDAGNILEQLRALQEKISDLEEQKPKQLTEEEIASDLSVPYPWGKYKLEKGGSDDDASNKSSDESDDEWATSRKQSFTRGKWDLHDAVTRLLDEEDDTRLERSGKFIKKFNRKWKEPVGGHAKPARADPVFQKYNSYTTNSTVQKDDGKQKGDERKWGVAFKVTAAIDWRLEQLSLRLFEQKPNPITENAVSEAIASIRGDLQDFIRYSLSIKQHTRLDRRTKIADRINAPPDFREYLKLAGSDSPEYLWGPTICNQFLTSKKSKREDDHDKNMQKLARSFESMAMSRRGNSSGPNNNRGNDRGRGYRGGSSRGRGDQRGRGRSNNYTTNNNNSNQPPNTETP